MTRRFALLHFVFGLTLLSFFLEGCASRHDLKPGRTRFEEPVATVPARILGNHFIVEVRWDRHGPWRFLVDTGSSVTLASPELARRYATEKAALDAPSIHVRSADGKSTLLPAVTLEQIQLGDARFDNVQALIYDFAELSAHLGVKIDGVLGFPLFRETVLTLDYPQRRMVLTPASPLTPLPPGATIKFNNSQNTPLIPVHLGNESLIALIDSGSDGPFMLNPVGLHPRFVVGPRPGTTVGTLTGTRTQEIGRIEQPLDIGPYRIEMPVVDLTDQLSAIGGETLRHFAVTFDQSRNQVTFSRESPAPIAREPRRSSGMSFSKTPTYWRIAGIVPDSPADEAGVQRGDLVTRINGESVNDWNLARFDATVQRASEITYTFLRGTQEVPVVISTFDLVP